MRDKVGEKLYKDYVRVSRYAVFPYYYNKTDNKYFYGVMTNLDKEIRYVNHKVVRGDTLDTLSLYYYNNPLYYWAIADMNDIYDPYEDLEIGRILKIPTFSDIQFDM